MRALVFHGPGDLRVEPRPDPTPDPDQVLLRITATGICGSDLHGYTGASGRRHPGQVMGHETVGRIEAVGTAVPHQVGLSTGQVVTVNPVLACGSCAECAAGTEQRCAERRVIGVDPTWPAAFAELMVVPAANVVRLSGGLPEEYGALVEPLAVGYHAAVCGAVREGEQVFVVGGGPIGQACALAARRLGATQVVVSEPDPRRRALVGALGLATVDAVADDLAGQVREQLGGPATVVLDAVGSSTSLAAALAGSGPGARIVLVGMDTPELTVAAYAISTYERSVIGSFCYTAAEFRQTAQWVGTGPPGLADLIDGLVDLAGAPAAFAALAAGEMAASKVLVRCGEGES